MSNFGAGQGLFGTNQNKNQGTSTPSASALATSAQTQLAVPRLGGGHGKHAWWWWNRLWTNWRLFGGGSAFGSGGNTNTSTSTPSGAGTGNPFGGSLFAGVYASYSIFMEPPHPNITQQIQILRQLQGLQGQHPGGPFSGASSNQGTSGTTAGQGLFGNTGGGANTGGAGASMFGFPKPAASGASPFASATGAGSTTPAATGPSASSNTLGGGLFGNIKPADSAAKPAPSPSLLPRRGSSIARPRQSVLWFHSQARRDLHIIEYNPSTLPSGGLFKPPGASTTATTPAANQQSAFSLGGPAALQQETRRPQLLPLVSVAAGGGLFGNIGATTNKPEEKKDGASIALPTFSLGGQPTGTAAAPEKRDGAAASSLFPGLGGATSGTTKPATSLGVSTSSSAPGTLALTTTTTSAISVAPPSMLKGKSMKRSSTEVAVWDRSLIENGNNVARALYSHVLAAEREQNDIDQSLDHIEQQEKELSATVEMYEKQMSDILGGQGGTLRTLDTGPADTERDKNYMLATELHNHLDDLSSSLTQLIDSVNSMSIGQNDSKAASADDPMTQIAHVLSNHLESLQWIDGASRELEEKVGEVEKRIKDVGTVSQVSPPWEVEAGRGASV
ncbi:Nsp1-like C-terminal region-domain-containing protein [Russula vinacea]|nr:Nsp1-like C-terminal region-domain-containing protein [Russula vinacea]